MSREAGVDASSIRGHACMHACMHVCVRVPTQMARSAVTLQHMVLISHLNTEELQDHHRLGHFWFAVDLSSGSGMPPIRAPGSTVGVRRAASRRVASCRIMDGDCFPIGCHVAVTSCRRVAVSLALTTLPSCRSYRSLSSTPSAPCVASRVRRPRTSQQRA
jgi:hypothetical protein